MKGTETRLKLFVKIIAGKVGVELCSNSFFKNFGNEGQV